MKNIKRFSWVLIVLMMAIAPMSVMAQDTASAIRGTVTDTEGNIVSGATVVVKHLPTGSTKTYTTNESGNYQARGLRVGGPYMVSISNSGYADATQEDIYISLGETQTIDAAIAAN
ncbi:MAG: carboxypeptidase-like regulatory domain-containing protein, partial [Marinicellaceae bacterium]